MGHERVGALPRTKQWRRLVDDIAAAGDSPAAIEAIATQTLYQVRGRFEGVPNDAGFQAAFAFVVALTTPSALSANEDYPSIDLDENPSALRLTAQLARWVDRYADSLEYAELSKRAAADAIVYWTIEHGRQGEIFSQAANAAQTWRDSRSAGAFSDLSRVFFGKFTERYLKYFLDRAASAELSSVAARDAFEVNLERHIDDLARHSFETTKIAQSFAAGWYNRHASTARPSRREVRGFLRFAMGKLRQELLRQSQSK